MRIDAYTKLVLTVIAVMLTVIACRPLLTLGSRKQSVPDTTSSATSAPKEPSWASAIIINSSNSNYDFSAIDPRTGDYWEYHATRGSGSGWNNETVNHAVPPSWTYLGRISGPGGSISNWKQWWKDGNVPIPADAPDVVTYKP